MSIHDPTQATAQSMAIVSSDGQRYVHKPTGTPFQEAFANGHGTMSCLLCGRHRTPAARRWRVLGGKRQVVCEPACR